MCQVADACWTLLLRQSQRLLSPACLTACVSQFAERQRSKLGCTPGGNPIRLPHEWHKTVPHTSLVVGITGQISGEEAFFVKEPPYQKWNHRGDREKSPVRAKRQRRTENVQ